MLRHNPITFLSYADNPSEKKDPSNKTCKIEIYTYEVFSSHRYQTKTF